MSKRDKILEEIYTTEVSYLRSLQTCQAIYYDDMTSRIPPIVKQKDVEEMFLHLDDIISVSSNLVNLFESARKEGSYPHTIGNIFIQVQPYLKAYNMFVANSAYALNRATFLYTKPKYSDYLEQLRNSIEGPENGKLDLNSFLVMPVQRVPRYRMLLEDLLKHTEDSYQGKSSLKTALDDIKSLAMSINESIADEERRRALLSIKNKLPKDLRSEFVRPWRKFVMKLNVKLNWGGKNTTPTLFLLSDLILFGVESPKDIAVDHVLIISRILKTQYEETSIEMKTKDDKSITIHFNTQSDKQKIEESLKELFKTIKKLPKNINTIGECACCRKFLKRASCPDTVLCAMCNKEVCYTCATTKISLVSGGAPRKVCDACILDQYRKQQETLQAPRKKKAPLELNAKGKLLQQENERVTMTQSTLLFNTQSQSGYMPCCTQQSMMMSCFPCFNVQQQQTTVQHQNTQGFSQQKSQTALLKSLSVPQRRKPHN
ncbi:Rho/RAC guanine nucleotide exchange factor, putative [Entamoeba invadens IP1]|uniref:Rho/RAC guanine nucleotide exchange factor, putative n=1 Tax=Entamoeba invadens IP1 TaxID=370355 RepID=A0A0A1UE69_ENTIV|nr:Rho/RAC guanine nucleotide exchange factor, putative [Entamoeba invadens IP1]ELP91100.1 Rho/RAC guanine nucleotide exchange factor, putative [Entamoeba invadens IP1]|eukprot:XP_004257871.1 Rho/RAC guanine nucleotide exchange factor, putative [Entamoeba invadens IP1]